MKFDCNGSRQIEPFSVKFVDGQTKVLNMLLAIAIAHKLGLARGLVKAFGTYEYILCSYVHREAAALFHYDALRFLAVSGVQHTFQNIILRKGGSWKAKGLRTGWHKVQAAAHAAGGSCRLQHVKLSTEMKTLRAR